ncbi:MAG TPA: hypothetical protein VGW38_21900, partial [Chloroflexota bacterium]|nr:hypothetical protein [Chloroflexota bacterium]
SLPSLVLAVLLWVAPLTRPTWGLIALPTLLMAVGVGVLTGGVIAIAVALILAGVALFVAYDTRRTGKVRWGKAILFLALSLVNDLPWLLLGLRVLLPDGLYGR